MAAGTRVRMTTEAFGGAEWYGTVTGDQLQADDTRIAVKIDSGAVILYEASEVEAVG